MRVTATLILICLLPLFGPGRAASGPGPGPARGAVEVIARLDINPGNLAVTADGRIFATVHQFRPGPVSLIEVLPPSGYAPWPGPGWNRGTDDDSQRLNSPLGVQIDRRNRLWVVDNGRGALDRPPKLLAFSVDSGEPVYRFDFPHDVGPPGSFIQDLAVDAGRGWVFLADAGGLHEPAIVAVDTRNGRARRFSASPALAAENVDLVVERRVLQVAGDEGEPRPARVAINPITLSADGETLYFGAMSGTNWYSVPTSLFRSGAPDEAIAAAVLRVGPKPLSDGASTDAQGSHYFTNLRDNAIDVLRPEGRLTRLVQDDRLSWPDALSFGPDGWLYVAVNQLHRSPPFNRGVDRGSPPYLILRVWTDAPGIPGR